MATFDVALEVDFYDAAEKTATRRYILREEYDDGTDNWADVITAGQDAVTAINVLTMASTPEWRLAMIVPGSGTPNVAANNQVVAFTRIRDINFDKSSFEIPSWDDVVFDENNQNVLSDAYDTAAAALALFLKAPETGENFVLSPDYSQSRTRKSRDIIHD